MYNDDDEFSTSFFEEVDQSFAMKGHHGKGSHPTGFAPQTQQMTTKIPPSFDGSGSWFHFEELIDDWCDVTELDAEKGEDQRFETL